MKEIPLQFGMVSNAVQVGNTIHRDTGAWTPTIHTLLAFLNDNGFTEAPKVLGFDEKGREVLQFIEGEEASRPWPQTLCTGNGIAQAGKLLRKYHDTVVDFKPPNNAVWRLGKIKKKPSQIIRHGDLGPWNFIWHVDMLTGLIDWDFAYPGERIDDLAQMAYYFVPLRGEEGWREAGFKLRPNFKSRLNALVTSYGMFSVDELLESVVLQQQQEQKLVIAKSDQGIEPWATFRKRGDVEESQKDVKWLRSMIDELKA